MCAKHMWLIFVAHRNAKLRKKSYNEHLRHTYIARNYLLNGKIFLENGDKGKDSVFKTRLKTSRHAAASLICHDNRFKIRNS